MRIDERAPPDVHYGRRVTFETILTTGPSRCGAGFKALLIIDEDECSPLDSVANRHEMIPPKAANAIQRREQGKWPALLGRCKGLPRRIAGTRDSLIEALNLVLDFLEDLVSDNFLDDFSGDVIV